MSTENMVSNTFDLESFIEDLETFVRFKTCVKQNESEFSAAREWIQNFFDPDLVEFETFTYKDFTSLLIKPTGSIRPSLLGDGHIEVVPAANDLFELRREGNYFYGRGVADMKTQCLMMMTVLRDMLAIGEANDFWLLFSEDEEIGSEFGVRKVAQVLDERGCLPEVVFVPDGGPDFAYVEKEKGLISFRVTMKGEAAHGSRPFLGINAIEQMMVLYRKFQAHFPNPDSEKDWVPSLIMSKIEAGQARNQVPDHCSAFFDLRFTENEAPEEIIQKLEDIGQNYNTKFSYSDIGLATYYPKERPIAQQYIELLERVSGKEPPILHTNGASNSRFYVTQKPDIQVLMTNPTVAGAHSDSECLDARSLPAYYSLIKEMVKLTVGSIT